MDKSSSSVKLPNIEKKGSAGGDDGRERFHARNWKALSKKEIQKLPPQQRSKYLALVDSQTCQHRAGGKVIECPKRLSRRCTQSTRRNPLVVFGKYEPGPKECSEAMSAARKRLKDLNKSRQKQQKPAPIEEVVENEKHTKIIGQLKAAEARNRIRLMRLRYQNNRSSEVTHLISCQPTALKAVRLQSLVPPSPDKIYIRDLLVKNERHRVNSLLEDETGLETARLLT